MEGLMGSGGLVGYVQKDDTRPALKICILKEALDKLEVQEGTDGTRFIRIFVNLDDIRGVIDDEQGMGAALSEAGPKKSPPVNPFRF